MNCLQITICLPTYNGATYLEETLMSIYTQTFINHCEILIVDDGSTDNTLSIANNFIQNHQHLSIRVVQNKKNKGLVENWNECLKLAKGEWIKFQFQDDLMDNDCIEKLYKAANSSNASVVLCDRKYFWKEEIPVKQEEFLSKLPRLANYIGENRMVLSSEIIKILKNDFIAHNFLGEPIAGMFKKELVNRYGYFNKSLSQICDFEFWLRLVVNVPFYYLNEPIVKFRVHGASQTFKNSRTSEIKTSHQDRIKLGAILLKNKVFAPVRVQEQRDENSIYSNYINLLLQYRRSYGLFKLIKFWKKDWFVLQYILQLTAYRPKLLIYDIQKVFR